MQATPYPRFFLPILLGIAYFLAASPTLLAQRDFSWFDANPVEICEGFFVDGGGRSGPHRAGVTDELTICPTSGGGDGRAIQLRFREIDISGTMSFYNGRSTDDELLQVVDTDTDFSFIVRAGRGNTSGCLTVVFEAGSFPRGGWLASVSCVVNCQQVVAQLDQTAPPAGPDGAINVCPGDAITFSGSGSYPASGTNYDQSDATSTFLWNFQDGTTAEGPQVTKVFDEPGGYVVQLAVTDLRGCRNTNRIDQRVRVAPPPDFSPPADFPDGACPGEVITLTAAVSGGGSGGSTVTPQPVTTSFTTSQEIADTTALPDGVGLPVNIPLIYESFAPGQRLQAQTQITRICADLEHSFLGDLDIYLICPSGDSLPLFLRTPRVRNVNLGMGDETTDPAQGDFDAGARYCWTLTAAETMTDYIRRNDLGLDPGEERDRLPGGDYLPESGAENFAELVGCELNGQWTLSVTDNEAVDNGTLFGFFLEFTEETYPPVEEFTVPLDRVFWEQTPNLAFYQPDSIVLRPPNAGVNSVRLVSEDAYGCRFDTTYDISTRSALDPACRDCPALLPRSTLDTTICAGNAFVPDLVRLNGLDTLVTWRATPSAEISGLRYPNTSQAYLRTMDVEFVQPQLMTDPADVLERVCLELDNPTGDLSELTIELFAPNNRSVTLVRDLGGPGDDLSATCFTAFSSNRITDGATAPFTGDFLPAAGGWENFAGSPTNGRWVLRATDAAGNDVSTLLRWDLTFRHRNTRQFSWAPDDGTLSCTDCPNPIITPATDGAAYTLTVSDPAGGCPAETATVTVSFDQLELVAQPAVSDVRCNGQTNGSIDLNISSAEPGLTYAWSTGATTSSVSGLAAGEYELVVTNPSGCREVREFTVGQPAELALTLDGTDPASCLDAADGQIRLSTAGGTPPYSYAWTADLVDPTLIFNDPQTEDIGALNAGEYRVLVTDANGCTTGLTATVEQPNAVVLDLTSTNVVCFGEANGTATATVAGGTFPYRYRWSTGDTTAVTEGLTAGDYSLTVTDANNCLVVGSEAVSEPPTALALRANPQELLGCAGGTNSRASVEATGGYGEFAYRWGNGERTAVADSLAGGPVTVSVTDAGGCTVTTQLDIDQLQPVTINILQDPPSCNGSADGLLTATPMGGSGRVNDDYTYRWSTGDTDIAADNLRGGATYSVTATDNLGCTGEESFFLRDPQPIQFNLDATPADCAGAATGVLSISNVTGPVVGDYFFRWDAGAGSATTPRVGDLAAGSYRVTITDEIDQCEIDTLLTVTEPRPLAANAEQRNVGCHGDADGRLTVSPTGGVGNYRLSWSTGSAARRIEGLPAGRYTLTLTDDNGCVDSTAYDIRQPDPVEVRPTPLAARCFGEPSGEIALVGAGGRPPFSFRIGDGPFSRNGNFRGLQAGTFQVFVRDSSGCTVGTEVEVPDGPTFTIELGPDIELPFGDSITLMAAVDGGAPPLRYRWRGSYAGSLDCDTCAAPVARPEFAIDYRLVVTDADGCTDEDRLRILVPKVREVDVPTGFTPNGDRRNDRLLVHGRPRTRVVAFAVFDRWGGQVFADGEWDVNDPTRGWDGNIQGDPAPAGVYFYKLTVRYEDDSEETRSGQTTLIR